MGNFLQQQESLIFWVILSCMENLTGYQLFMAALPLASRIRKVICGDLKNVSRFVATQYAKCQITAKKKTKKPTNLNSVPTENTQFPLAAFYDFPSSF